MKIIVLDGATTNPGDLSWEPLEQLGSCDVHERTAPADVLPRAREAEIVIVNKVLLTAEVIAQLPRLRYIGLLSTGVNVVDLDAAARRGIPVCNVPGYSTRSVAQLVFSLLLALAQHAEQHGRSVREGRWSRCEDFCYWETEQIELDGRTLGVIGLGQIGQRVACIGQAFGMEVIAHTRTRREPAQGVRRIELDDVFRQADVVSLHCPLTAETDRMVDTRRLALMKPTAYLINTGRGGLVDEAALAEALVQGRIAGAGLDVLTNEPPPETNPLLRAPNCIVTPHIGWATRAARQRLIAEAARNVSAFLDGAPRNNVVRQPPAPTVPRETPWP